MLNAAEGMLHAGGLAVNVDSSGKSQSRQNWAALAAHDRPVALYHAFVIVRGNSDSAYSSGMLNLGLPDVILDTTIPDADTAHLMETFLLYTFMEKPDLQSGHTFVLEPAIAELSDHDGAMHALCRRPSAVQPLWDLADGAAVNRVFRALGRRGKADGDGYSGTCIHSRCGRDNRFWTQHLGPTDSHATNFHR